jgi:hypothetical protein
MRGDQRRSRESWKTTLTSPGPKLDNWHSDSLKKFQLILSQGKKKKVDDVAHDEEDDKVKTNHVSSVKPIH